MMHSHQASQHDMLDDVILTRRNMIRRAGMGFGALGLRHTQPNGGAVGSLLQIGYTFPGTEKERT